MRVRSIALVLVTLIVAGLPGAAAARKRPVACGLGRRLIDPTTLPPALAGSDPFVALTASDDDRTFTLADCTTSSVRIRARKAATVMRVVWKDCRGLRRVRLDARLAAPACTDVVARLRVERARFALAAPVSACGDQLFDPVGGEACEPSIPGSDADCVGACMSDCRWDPARVVQTSAGGLCGAAADGIRSFLAIPYAAPPVGIRRWRPPIAAGVWTGLRAATTPPPVCAQQQIFGGGTTGEEDCLYLNVVTPDPPPTTPAPVIVWIHTGAFLAGDGFQSGSTSGAALAARTGAVVVTLNYRLGPLGFLAHANLTAEDPIHPSSGNYGFEDQVAALTWVHDHIAAFGGDPTRVTLAGQSAGGWSTCLHLVSPRSTGLFQRAIIESGVCPTAPTLAAAETQGERFLMHAACTGVSDPIACLRARTPDEIIAAYPPPPAFVNADGGAYQPNIDGTVIPRAIETAFSSGDFNRVPVLIGANADEGTLFVASAFGPGMQLTAQQYPTVLEALFDDTDVATAVAVRYPLAGFATPGHALSAVIGDGILACPTIAAATRLAAHTPVHLYEFTYPDAPYFFGSAGLGAYHTAEIQYLFGVPAAGSFGDDDITLSHLIQDYWVQFAATGDPNRDGLPPWAAVASGNSYLALDVPPASGTNLRQDACGFWAPLGYPRSPLP